MSIKVTNLKLFIITSTEEDKIMHEYAIKNFIINHNEMKDINNYHIIYKKTKNPYRIKIMIKIGQTEKRVWNFLVLVPVHKENYNDPWAKVDDWKNSLGIMMKKNLAIAATIRDKSSKYLITRKNEFESICNLPFQSFGEKDFYPTVLDKASIILYTIVKDHPFYDGNKRTALLTCISFLNSCGFDFIKENSVEIVERVKDFMIYVAKSKPSEKDKILFEINEFIKNNITIHLDYQVYMNKVYKDIVEKMLKIKFNS